MIRRRVRAIEVGMVGSAIALSACLARFEVGEAETTTGDQASETAASEGSGTTAAEAGTESAEGQESETGDSGCGDACDPLLEVCVAGDCECRPDFERCAGVCVDLDSDPGNCGSCGESCDAGACEDGECQAQGCSETIECEGACVELDSSPLHCGGCGSPCSGDELCVEGECVGYAIVDCVTDLECGAGTCCEVEHFEAGDSICVNGDQCP